MKQKFTQPFHLFFVHFLLLIVTSYGTVNAQCSSTSLATSYVSNNGSRGAMFNIVAGANPVTVTGFSANLYGGTTARYEIYYKAGTYVGSETTAGNWTMAGGVNALYAAANNVPTYIPIPMSITIPANATYGFYVTNTASGGINYTSSAVTNVTLATNSDLSVVGGVGKSYPFGSTYSYRLFNGTVHYYTGSITETGALATGNTVSPVTSQNASGTTVYGTSCDVVISKVVGSGASPISGNTTATVWVESTQPTSYVKRHYEITPETNAATATGTVTLYFTQAEFDAFNVENVTQLPHNAADAENYKGNLRIEKRGGTSSNGTGLPNTYPGAPVDIIPTSVSWNATASRWEVVFNVTGFSGFFAKSTLFTLPLKLLDFSVSKVNGVNHLLWTTAEEFNTKEFILETSTDGVSYSAVAIIAASGTGNNTYQYKHAAGISPVRYYRLRINDVDGRFELSKVIAVNTSDSGILQVAPNPVQNELLITISPEDRMDQLKLIDINGRTVLQQTVSGTAVKMNLLHQPNGIYLLKISSSVTKKQRTERIVINH